MHKKAILRSSFVFISTLTYVVSHISIRTASWMCSV